MEVFSKMLISKNVDFATQCPLKNLVLESSKRQRASLGLKYFHLIIEKILKFKETVRILKNF